MRSQRGRLRPISQTGVDIAPGGSFTARWQDSNSADATTTVTPASGDYSGTIYLDRTTTPDARRSAGTGGLADTSSDGAPGLIGAMLLLAADGPVVFAFRKRSAA